MCIKLHKTHVKNVIVTEFRRFKVQTVKVN